ncbi:Exocyst complex component 7 [Araneus ventricosus]|uniref:Exocyst complex component 7 n=1 Tax=Araneus ventricosus TaxID=182803 RepID=A0A4Y2THR7_ARAVE|nr:Exocyst complex component 7 [Araneus ventricosus]
MREGVCTKQYPKEFREKTEKNINGYPMYQRKCTESSVRVGHDAASIRFENENTLDHDEILSVLDGRYVSAPEAMWHLNEFNLSEKSRTVLRLAVHLPDQLAIIYQDGQEEEAVARAAKRQTTLTAWFVLNKNNHDSHNYLYTDIPHYRTFNKSAMKWQKWQRGGEKGSRRSIAKESTPRRPPKKIQQMFVRKATAVIAKYSPTVESAMLGHRFQSSHLNETKDEVIENDVMSFMTSVSGLLKLMQSELNLMNGVIPNKDKKIVFERVVTQAMENLVSEGELIVSKVKKSVSRHEFSAALNLFPILRHLIVIKADFEKLFQGCSSTLYDKLKGFVITVQATISKTLEEFIESIKNDPDTKMPKDGTVHQLTSNAIMLLEQLQDYQDILSSVLTLQDASFAASKDKGKLAFAQYITRVLSTLTTTLNNKSNYYSDGFLCAIFRLNNLHYILKALQRTGLIEIVKLHASDVEKNLNLQIRDQKRVYSQSWSRVLHYVMEVDKPISQQRAVSNTSQLPSSMKVLL